VILWIGLFAGTLDITDNLIFNQLRGITPKMVFQYIASGLIGPSAAVQGGAATVALGVAIHYAIALTWTAIFYAASRKFAILSRRPVVSGLVYGGAIHLFMNFIILRSPEYRIHGARSRLLQGSPVCSLFSSSLDYPSRFSCDDIQTDALDRNRLTRDHIVNARIRQLTFLARISRDHRSRLQRRAARDIDRAADANGLVQAKWPLSNSD